MRNMKFDDVQQAGLVFCYGEQFIPPNSVMWSCKLLYYIREGKREIILKNVNLGKAKPSV